MQNIKLAFFHKNQLRHWTVPTLNDADNLENFEDTCINTAIDTISATIASTSKNGIIAFRAPSSARGKVTLMASATFDACKLLILSNKKRNRQENGEIL